MDRSRRQWLSDIALAGLAAGIGNFPAGLSAQSIHRRPVPADGRHIPLIGLGSWLTFDVPPEDPRRETCLQVIKAFFEAGGGMIDSSPMYGYSQDVIGESLRALNFPASPCSATKVWIPGGSVGQRQMELAAELWGVERFDLLLVHNLLDWETHLKWLVEWRESGRVGYIGVTTSHGRRHADLKQVIRTEPVDFIQLTYNIMNREADRQLLPLAMEHGKAVVINRPFAGGSLFRRVAGKPLPEWVSEIDCNSWAQFFLKYIVSHPAVTCAIPATSRVDHLQENMAVLTGRLPGPEMRREMADYFDAVS